MTHAFRTRRSSELCLGVQRMRLKMAERDKLKRLLMRGLKHDQRREAGLPRLFPARGAQAPAVALMQPAKAIFGAGGGQVVADGAGELQELVRDDDADGMHAAIRRIGFAAAVADRTST